MKEGKEVGAEARSHGEIPEKKEIDIKKIMQQCGIHPEKWRDYINAQQR